jgi:hypothetical protein
MNYEDIPKGELILVSEKMIGIVLMNIERDSDGNAIRAHDYYRVEKHTPSGMLIIFNTGSNFHKEFVDNIGNKLLKKSGKLN